MIPSFPAITQGMRDTGIVALMGRLKFTPFYNNIFLSSCSYEDRGAV